MTRAESAIIFKALSDETRLSIIDMLSCNELCACELLEKFNITQPTLSYHMRILSDSGIINGRKDGSMTRYTLNENVINSVKLFFEQITAEKKNCICKEQSVCNI